MFWRTPKNRPIDLSNTYAGYKIYQTTYLLTSSRPTREQHLTITVPTPILKVRLIFPFTTICYRVENFYSGVFYNQCWNLVNSIVNSTSDSKPITVPLTKIGLPLTDPMPLSANWILEELPCQERHFRLRLKLRQE